MTKRRCAGKRIGPEARGFVCAVKRANVIGATDQRTTSASGLHSPRKKAEDMTASTTRTVPKITLDERVPSSPPEIVADEGIEAVASARRAGGAAPHE